MKKKSIIVYSIFACVIYVLALTYFAFNLSNEYINGSSRTRRRFDHTAATIQESMKKINSENYDAQTIKNIITNSFGSMNDFAYIEFYENGYTIYSYKTNTLTEGSTSKLLHNYVNTFRVNDKEYFFTANLYNLRPTSIFIYGKRAFLVILIVTIITFILIVITNLKEVQSQESYVKEEISDEAEEEISIFEKEPEAPTEDEKIEAEVVTEKEESVESEEEIENSDESSTDETSTDEPILDDIKEDSEVSVEETGSFEITDEEQEAISTPVELPSEIEYEPKQEMPEGLYSPETGLSFEPFLETKLNNEINRSIASENDLALFLIQLPSIERNSALFKQICNYLLIQFQYKELVFEYKSDSIAAIKINSTIDEAITFADKIHSDIKNIINDDNIACYIGITSRTIRMVSAERLLIEADEALDHAKEDKKCPIIAFRADAEKFRLANL